MIDYSAYTTPISSSQKFYRGKAHISESFKNRRTNNLIAHSVVPVFVIFMFSLYFMPGFISDPLGSLWTMIVFAPLIVLVVFQLVVKNGEKLLRMEQFCNDNNFELSPKPVLGEHEGVLFNKGHSHRAQNMVSGATNGLRFTLFDYFFITGSGKNARKHSNSVAIIHIHKNFPHILLDSKRDSSISGLEFDKSQKLSLEGNFDKYFNVYGPKEYEIEVLQILNPKFMQSLLSNKEPFDIEIRGTKLYIYNHGTDRNLHTMQAFFDAIDNLSENSAHIQKTFKMVDQIGDQKPILKKSNIGAVIGIAIFILFILLQASS